MASGITELDLPVLAIPDLFIPQKLVEPASPRLPSYSSAAKAPLSVVKETNKQQAPANSQIVSPPATYSTIAANPYKREPTPELDSSEGSTSDESIYGDDLPHDAVVAAMASSSSRYINPKIVECFAYLRQSKLALTSSSLSMYVASLET